MIHRGVWLISVDGPCIDVNFLPGKFVTEKNAAHELAKDIENMWSGNIFDYSLRRLLLLYYRSHFASNREVRYRDLIKMKAEEAKKRKNKKLKTRSRDLLWQRRRMVIRRLKKCEEFIHKATSFLWEGLIGGKIETIEQAPGGNDPVSV